VDTDSIRKAAINKYCYLEFSDAMSPIDDDFLENVKAEATYQVRRINHHPSLAVWVGNNELEVGLPLILLISKSEGAAVEAVYNKLFLDVLIHVVFENTRSISYSPSSVTNGYLSFNISSPTPMVERFLNVTPGTISGNTDYYNYDASQAFNNSAYPVGRFATEFGFHSMPSLQSWEKVLPPSDLYFNSSVILSRNHHYPVDIASLLSPVSNQTNASLGGMGQMAIAGETYYPVPPTDTTSVANFSSWIYTSQVFQSDFYRNQISFYRSGSGRPERTLGALYWQLNEMWQTPSWAGLEHDGRWKMVHYIAKDVFEPVIVAPQFDQNTGGLKVWAVSDLWSTAKGHATITWYDWNGKVLSTSTSSVSIGAINATVAFDINVHNIGLDQSNAFAKCSVEVQGVAPNSKSAKPTTYKHETWFHAEPLAKQPLINPRLSIKHDPVSSTFVVRSPSRCLR
jgi:beta-mannosidase